MTGSEKFSVNPYLHTVLTFVFGLLLLVGGSGLVLTIGVEGGRGEAVDCGSVATGLPSSVAHDPGGKRPASQVAETVATCEAALTTRRTWAWPATAVGALGLVLVLLLVRWVHPPPRWWFEDVKGSHR
ncbi:hypothetical protein ABZ816_33855 [Actinosynnema sp. NPDC047251]|uniref:Putative membrane protein n=1 Tax=Saccharothrix espanaensis (strain ATCC 51144 / DSM 44229 / JCM 9112 / NBRC 15066 / NRRL 15764) TaxID=1179773 RepID=K0K6I4_SACES|nr:hypothetical protein [Saccharothrix espanaensis]CCH33102.1 putative membrane protein [Saccharothrix espanaensis DSM 44229]